MSTCICNNCKHIVKQPDACRKKNFELINENTSWCELFEPANESVDMSDMKVYLQERENT